jgi:hypothetical protein
MSLVRGCSAIAAASGQVCCVFLFQVCVLKFTVTGGSVRDVASRTAGGGVSSAAWGSALSLSGSMMLGGGRHSGGSSGGSIRDFSATRHSFDGGSNTNYWDRSLISMYEPVSAPQ